MAPLVTIREAGSADRAFLEHVLAMAAEWRSPTPRAFDEVLMLRELAHCVDASPAPGDFGLLAEMDDPIGTAWWWYFPAHDPGYGPLAPAARPQDRRRARRPHHLPPTPTTLPEPPRRQDIRKIRAKKQAERAGPAP